jgi:hypothetical protein
MCVWRGWKSVWLADRVRASLPACHLNQNMRREHPAVYPEGTLSYVY